MRRHARAPVAAAVVGAVVSLAACGAQPTQDRREPERAPGAADAAVGCPDSEVPQGFLPEGADLRHATYSGGLDHGIWLRSTAEAYGQAHGLEVGVLAGNLYSSPVPYDLTARLAGTPPADVLSAFVGGVLRSCAERGLLLPLDELWEERGWAEALPPAVTELATVDGHRYWAPTTVQWNPVFYRADVFAELGIEPPSSWQELLAVCDTLRAEGRAAFTSSGTWSPPMARYFTLLNLRLNGALFHQQLLAGERSWTDPALVPVFEHWREMIDRGCFSDGAATNDFGEATAELGSGDAAMWAIGEWLYEFIAPSAARRLDFFSFPVLDPGVPRAEIALLQGAAVGAATSDPEAAVGLAAELASPRAQRSQFRELGRVATDPRVDLPYDDVHARAHQFLRDADSLVGLLEFTAQPDYAAAMLSAFVRFLAEPDDLDALLAELESKRISVFGDRTAQ